MGRFEGATVLIVEDEPDLADLYAGQLEERFEVRTAQDAESALEAMDEEVDVVLLDRRLPQRPGEELLPELRSRGSDVRVAMVTAVMPDFDIVDMDFDDYLVKPVSREGLQSAVRGMLVRSTYRELLQEYFSLTSKRATLRAHKDDSELEASEEFERLETRIESVREELDSIVARFEHEDFRVIYEELS